MIPLPSKNSLYSCHFHPKVALLSLKHPKDKSVRLNSCLTLLTFAHILKWLHVDKISQYHYKMPKMSNLRNCGARGKFLVRTELRHLSR